MDLSKQFEREINDVTHPDVNRELPVGLRIFALLTLIYTCVSTLGTASQFWKYIFTLLSSESSVGLSTTICEIVQVTSSAVLTICTIVLSVMLIREKRRSAARFIYVIYTLLSINLVSYIMLEGIGVGVAVFLAEFVILIALQIYLDPSLRQERALERAEQDERWREQQEQGTLGFDRTGKGAIEINFFNVFWIFVVCSFIGLLVEEAYHFIFVVPGEWQDRAGLLFGPFSPIYGFGAVIMSIALNRLHKCPVLVIFLFSAIIGGLFEVFVAYFMQYAFGAVAWDYSNEVLPLFGGRTCAKFMIMWGLLGSVWLKILMPTTVKIVNKIPWNWRYVLTVVAATLMLTNAIMTLQSLDCWYMRVSNTEDAAPSSNITHFYEAYFDDEYMENRFESMTIVPVEAVRGGKG